MKEKEERTESLALVYGKKLLREAINIYEETNGSKKDYRLCRLSVVCAMHGIKALIPENSAVCFIKLVFIKEMKRVTVLVNSNIVFKQRTDV